MIHELFAYTRWLLLALAMLGCSSAGAHGFAGKRFFPATLTIDDPFVADEADLLLNSATVPDEDGANVDVFATEMEWSKRITPRFGISLGGAYLDLSPDEGPSSSGWDNMAVGGKYLLLVDEDSETLLSAGIDIDLGGTGSKSAGAESFSVYTPALFFGKGLGGLPDAVKYLRPLTVTGIAGVSLPGRSSEADVAVWGITLQYNLDYLQSSVKNVHMNSFLRHLIPVIELPMETCISGGCGGQTSGYVNPGFIWSGRHGQLGIEAQIPVNNRTGSGTGFLIQFHAYLDDWFPKTLGAPLFRR